MNAVDQFWIAFGQEPTIFFVGSAISIFDPSNLPSAPALTNAVINALLAHGAFETVGDRFEGLTWPRMETVLQEIAYCHEPSALAALAPLRRAAPNAYHRFLAHHLGRQIPRIYTTNQDELIEAALRDHGLQDGIDYSVWVPGQTWEASRLPALIKLHGTLGQPVSIRTTLRQVSRGLPDDIALQLVDDLQSIAFCVLGYSGNDVDIRPTFLRAPPRRIHWLARTHQGFPTLLAQERKSISVMQGDLSSFLPGQVLSAARECAPAVSFDMTFIDGFVRTYLISRIVGLFKTISERSAPIV